MNKSELLAKHVIEELLKVGTTEFILCPGSRNSALVDALLQMDHIKNHFWFEERSGAFFALGRARESQRPVAIITTSGTAAAELLPAAMEAFYNHSPLVLITADRPRRFRGSGAPQAAEQLGLFGHYAPLSLDIAEGETYSLEGWDRYAPLHLNVCLEDPVTGKPAPEAGVTSQKLSLESFLDTVKHPMVVVSAISEARKAPVRDFLLSYQAPVFLESVSGLREDKRLRHLQIARSEKLWGVAARAGHPIDGVLRIGGVPTIRLWRDLEDRIGEVAVCCVSDATFSGLSFGETPTSFEHAFSGELKKRPHSKTSGTWLAEDREFDEKLEKLFLEEPLAEASLIHQLSKVIPEKSHVYLGNSLPIREWDLAATKEDRQYRVTASRGMSGIDGQIATFLGLSRRNSDNWAILGDLTTLYDMAGPWILQQMADFTATIVVVNNSGGQLFARLFPHKEYVHAHDLTFKPLADMWTMHYEKWETIPKEIKPHKSRLIELVPDNASSQRFWKKLNQM